MTKRYAAYIADTVKESGIYVKCPTCRQLGIVKADKNFSYFKCANCGNFATKERITYRYELHGHCKECGQYFKVEIKHKNRQSHRMLFADCPFCGASMRGNVQKTAINVYAIGKIQKADPFFGYELWFLTYFKNKPIWALNRLHLAALIKHLSCPKNDPAGFASAKIGLDTLPAFMKSAKNRTKIQKLFEKML